MTQISTSDDYSMIYPKVIFKRNIKSFFDNYSIQSTPPTPIIHISPPTGNNIGTITPSTGGISTSTIIKNTGTSSLDCTSKYYTLGLQADGITDYPVTICMWLYNTNVTNYETIIRWDADLTHTTTIKNYPRIYYYPGGTNGTYLRSWEDEDGTGVLNESLPLIAGTPTRYTNPGDWCFYAFVFYKDSNNNVRLKNYNNLTTDKLVKTSNITLAADTDLDQNDPFPTSIHLGDTFSVFHGYMDSIRVYNRELPLSDIQLIYNSEK